MKKAVLICLVCVLLLSACGRDGGEQVSTENETNNPIVTSAIPTQDEIHAMLREGKGGVYWSVDEGDFARSEPVTIYEARPFEGRLWDTLFPDVEVVSRKDFYTGTYEEMAHMTVSMDGQECMVVAHLISLSFIRMAALPRSLEPEPLLAALSGITGTEWAEAPDNEKSDETVYLCKVDGLFVDGDGYLVGEQASVGPSVRMSDSIVGSYVGVSITNTLGEAVGTVEAKDLVDPELMKAVCTSYQRQFLDLSPDVFIFDHAELCYYVSAQHQLLPAFVVYVKGHHLDEEGTLVASHTSMLLDAQTGEIMRGG